MLDNAYKQTIERINRQKPGLKELAIKVLSWITCAERPLTTSELQNALATKVGKSDLNQWDLPHIGDMVTVCLGLVAVDKESNIIRLVHYTTQEYFVRTQRNWFPGAQGDIATTCVTYLLFDAFETGFCPTYKEFKERLQINPLYDYAARNWGHHAAVSVQAERLVLDLLESEAKVSASSQAMMAPREHNFFSPQWITRMTGVHLAAYFGLQNATVGLLKNGRDPDLKDVNGWTPLWWAAKNGHEAVVKLLLTNDGVNVNSKDNHGWTLLSWAAWNGHEAVVKLLLAKDGVNVDSEDNYGWTPLSWAAQNGHEAVMKLLLAKDGINPDTKDKDGWMLRLWIPRGSHSGKFTLQDYRMQLTHLEQRNKKRLFGVRI